MIRGCVMIALQMALVCSSIVRNEQVGAFQVNSDAATFKADSTFRMLANSSLPPQCADPSQHNLKTPLPECAPFQAEAHAAYSQDLQPMWDNKLGEDHMYIANEVIIDRPIAEVFQAVTTSYLWVVCYPETVAVGGIARRPFVKGDVILEKFMFAGKDYAVFRYQVDTYEVNAKVLFHGTRILVADTELNRQMSAMARLIGGSFEYDLEELGPSQTKWTRKVHFYHMFPAENEAGRALFKAQMHEYVVSQQYGAALYVECTKRFMETEGWKTELFMAEEPANGGGDDDGDAGWNGWGGKGW